MIIRNAIIITTDQPIALTREELANFTGNLVIPMGEIGTLDKLSENDAVAAQLRRHVTHKPPLSAVGS